MLKNNRGVTLIELVMTIVIVSIAVVTLLAITSQTSERSVDPMIQQQAIAIGQSYLEEIVQKSFCDPDDAFSATDCPTMCLSNACTSCSGNGGGTEVRATFDDVCDYDGLTNNGAVSQAGVAIPGLGQYSVNVQVVDNNAVNLNGLMGGAGQVVRIDVIVTHPALQDSIMISGVRVNF